MDFTTDDQLSPAVRRTAVSRAAKATAEDVKLVFGATPTLKEAQETISDLSPYLSPDNSMGCNCSDLEPPALPALLQNAVASIACDPNVSNAVLQNPELQAFLQSPSVDLSGTSIDLNGSVANHSQLQREASFPNTQKNPNSAWQEHPQMLTKPLETTPTHWLQGIYRWLQGIFESLKGMYQNMKDAVVCMMTHIFDYLKKLFRATWDAVVGIMTKSVDYCKNLVGCMCGYCKNLVGCMCGYCKNLVGCMCGDKTFAGLVVLGLIVIISILLKRRSPTFKGFKA